MLEPSVQLLQMKMKEENNSTSLRERAGESQVDTTSVLSFQCFHSI